MLLRLLDKIVEILIFWNLKTAEPSRYAVDAILAIPNISAKFFDLETNKQ